MNKYTPDVLITRAILLLVLTWTMVGGCSTGSEEIHTFSGATMGTTYHIKYVDGSGAGSTREIQKKVDQKLKQINALMSTWDPDSVLSRINKTGKGQWIELSPDLVKLIGFAFNLSRKTNGRYDVTCGPLINLWGFGPNGEKKVPVDSDVEAAKTISGVENFALKQTQLKKKHDQSVIDLSSIAKGFGVDEVARVLEEFDIENYMVEIGGEIKTRGKKRNIPWKIAIESPRKKDGKALNKILRLTDCVMATSGDYRNFFTEKGVRYSHTIDPDTGRPVRNDLASVTVAIPSGECYKADAWATALMVSGRKNGFDLAVKNDIPAFFIYMENGRLKEMSTHKFSKAFL